ncbi:hypothetical protein FGL95_21345 [Nocardiaceae bacterium YC2-7]|jgi:nucleotide-binding universal stress UspA family protein|uniref:UspA domain-containing protein n=1 Tax=Antrihabitans stalactiti TaxID=2584121 RepID=A0A848KIG7_9NOCA|nr:universal stress protein [Antrihabitans sp. YC2-6]NMN97586.1 hypothetical protein [Antrihabitans stalactiti]
MTAYRTIIVGTDGSESSLKAVDKAGAIAGDADAELVVACAYFPNDATVAAAAENVLKDEVYQVRGEGVDARLPCGRTDHFDFRPIPFRRRLIESKAHPLYVRWSTRVPSVPNNSARQYSRSASLSMSEGWKPGFI